MAEPRTWTLTIDGLSLRGLNLLLAAHAPFPFAPVRLGSTVQLVKSGPSDQLVVAPVAEQVVVAPHTPQSVRAVVAEQGVRLGAAIQVVFAIIAVE
jgi:hypothetical protein